MIRFLMPKILSFTACVLACCCIGCVSHRKTAGVDENTGIKTHDEYYVANRSLKKFAAGDSSPLEKKVYNANKAFGGNTKFHTQNYAGAKEFTGTKAFTAKSFAQSGKEDKSASKAFAQAGEKNKLGDKTFATKDSRLAGKESRDEGKSFREGGTEFKTKKDAVATKAADKKDNQIVTTGVDEPLSEDAVKKLLNKH